MTTTPIATMRERFAALLSPDRVIDHPLERRLYSRDGSIAMGDAGLVVLPETTAEVVDCVRLAGELGVPVVPRGSGTGLCGGAVPLDGAIVLSVARMTRILDVDPAVPSARVEPGVLNLDLSVAVRHLGLHYAPDPSSQQACSIGGNVATNAGGPHCLASGVTAQHVLGMEIVLADGEVLRLGGPAPDPPGYDLRGFVVGGEGTLGVVTEVTVRLMRTPRHVRTMLLDFTSVRAAGQAVGDIIGGGVIPAAMEMMDQRMTVAVEAFVQCDLPVDAAAMLLVEVDGTEAEVAAHTAVVERVGAETGARRVRVARDAAEAALFWKARKSAFGAVARVAPNYYLHDCVVPRTRLVEILERIYEIGDAFDLVIMNVFHAGDGNLHPLILYDGREPGAHDRAEVLSAEILRLCIRLGGSITGEHGVGLEKRAFLGEMYAETDLACMRAVRQAMDPHGVANPGKKLAPAGVTAAAHGLHPLERAGVISRA